MKIIRMLSINIPVYNFEVETLVSQLAEQAEVAGIQYEIRVYDDGSEEQVKLKNRKLLKNPNVIYREMDRNLGRSAIRNRLGFDSEFEYLVFIDADSLLVNDHYLRNFVENARANRVLCGGTVYKPTKPEDVKKMLRWNYGTKREAIPAADRNRKKGFIITSNNFLIAKKVFQQVHFRETINKYGHEDTLLGYDLFRNGIEIFHIDNPVEHTGLEDAAVFLEKTKTALKNLYEIDQIMLRDDPYFSSQVNFLNKYKSFKKLVPPIFAKSFFNLFGKSLEKHLKGKKQSLFLFDIYKLTYFATLRNPTSI